MLYSDVLDPTVLTDARTAWLCARLNLRDAKRLLKKGSVTRAISALYDAVLFGMHYYIVSQEGGTDVDLGDATKLFHKLTCGGVFQDPQTFNRLSLMVERALWQGPASSDVHFILVIVEDILATLGVMPLQNSTSVEASKIIRTGKEGDAQLR